MVDGFMEESLVIEYIICQVHYEIFFIHCHLQSASSCWYCWVCLGFSAWNVFWCWNNNERRLRLLEKNKLQKAT